MLALFRLLASAWPARALLLVLRAPGRRRLAAFPLHLEISHLENRISRTESLADRLLPVLVAMGGGDSPLS